MTFSVDLGDIVAVLTIIGILGAWFHMIVIRPIKEVLYSIKNEMSELSNEIRVSRNERRLFSEQIARLEASVASAHHRIDEIKEECRLWHKGK